VVDIVAPDFLALAAQIRACGDDEPFARRTILANNINTILAALDLAPVGLAAVGYVERNSEPFSKRSWEAWDALERAHGVWREGQTK